MSLATRLGRASNRVKQLGLDNGKTAEAPPKQQGKRETVTIAPPNMKIVIFKLVGNAPYMQCRFSEKAQRQMEAKQTAGTEALKGKKKRHPPRDYDADYQGSFHQLEDGSFGIPCSAFRQAAMSACRLVDFKMTLLKLSLHIVQDGFDKVDRTPLVKIIGKPVKDQRPGRNSDMNRTPDIRVRARWDEWSAIVKIRFDADQFSVSDVYNLMVRIGIQVGIGEGRPDSRNSTGMSYGTFDVELAK